jgi:hypothetical protein
MNGEWPLVGVDLGFSPVSRGDPHLLAHCTPAVAHQLHQLYQDTLRHFDQAYSRDVVGQSGNFHTPSQVPPQPPHQHEHQSLVHQPTEADYRALLAIATSELSVMTAETMSVLPRFCDVSGAELEAHHAPEHVIAYIEYNRDHLKWLAQDPRFRTAFTPTESPQLVHQNGVQATVHSSLGSPQYHPQLQQWGLDSELIHGNAMMTLSLPQRQVCLVLSQEYLYISILALLFLVFLIVPMIRSLPHQLIDPHDV